MQRKLTFIIFFLILFHDLLHKSPQSAQNCGFYYSDFIFDFENWKIIIKIRYLMQHIALLCISSLHHIKNAPADVRTKYQLFNARKSQNFRNFNIKKPDTSPHHRSSYFNTTLSPPQHLRKHHETQTKDLPKSCTTFN